MPIKPIREFLHLETVSGILLFATALLALILDNSPWQHYYEAIIHINFGMNTGAIHIILPLVEWINQGLMTIFFLLVGLEIKREIFLGELNSLKKIALPAIAAAGGMILPAILYAFLNWHSTVTLRGWAIPSATDVAFSLAILSLLRSKVPFTLKIFLTALAIFDDVGAIIIIAVFYTTKISWLLCTLALLCWIVLILLNRFRVKNLIIYLVIGILLWLLLLQSGIHPVLAGILLAFAIPLHSKNPTTFSPLKLLEQKLHPYVAFLVLPLFGFANAGVSFSGIHWQHWFNSVTLGVMLGLFLGKQLGVFGASWLAVKNKIAHLPEQATWLNMYGIALICGVGFTMSLFIGTLAFSQNNNDYLAAVRVGVLAGSLLSGLVGFWVLRMSGRK